MRTVRPGYKVRNDWLTSTPSIVVTVRHKVAQPAAGELLPSEVDGVPVDVRQASPSKALELEDPGKYAAGHNTPPEAAGQPLTPPDLGSTQTPAFAQFFPPATVVSNVKIQKNAHNKGIVVDGAAAAAKTASD